MLSTANSVQLVLEPVPSLKINALQSNLNQPGMLMSFAIGHDQTCPIPLKCILDIKFIILK